MIKSPSTLNLPSNADQDGYNMLLMDGISLTPLKIIPGTNGAVMHALKNHEDDFQEFGEAYFSIVDHNSVKGWKKHKRMISNLIVPVGEILFVFYDDRKNSGTFGGFFQVELSSRNYQRLTVKPGIWMAFKGMGENLNLLLNISSIPHDPEESDTLELNNIDFDFKF